MAFLAPLAAGAGTVGATAGAAALAKGAALAGGSSLASGITAGTMLGGGASLAAMPALSYAGANLAAPALATKGLAAAAPGIFANPAAAGFLGKSFTAPGLLNTLGMNPLAGLAGSTGMVPTATGLTSLYSAVPAVATSPATGGLLNTLGMSPLGGAQALVPNATVAGQTAALEAAKGNIIGAGAQAQTNLARQLATDAAKQQVVGSGTQSMLNTANTNANVINAINQNVAGGAAQASPGVASAPAPYSSPIKPGANFISNLGSLIQDPSLKGAMDYVKEHPYASAAGAYGLYSLMKPKYKPPETSKGTIRPYELEVENLSGEPYSGSAERQQLRYDFTPLEPISAAEGGITGYAIGGPVETMTAMNAVGANTGYPMAGINTPMYSNPMVQRPEAVNVISPSGDAGVTAYSGEPRFAGGGISDLGGYSDGGRLLKGPGDGVSDSIPAVIGNKQPARLADGEFVVPARIVSELGNGSTEAGARKLYAMMDRVQKARGKTVGRNKVAANTKADKHLPA